MNSSTIGSRECERTDEGQQDKLRHGYLAAAREGRLPVAGDTARCGYVKQDHTGTGGAWGTGECCIVCERLRLRERERQ
jgi:hypothetical protein